MQTKLLKLLKNREWDRIFSKVSRWICVLQCYKYRKTHTDNFIQTENFRPHNRKSLWTFFISVPVLINYTCIFLTGRIVYIIFLYFCDRQDCIYHISVFLWQAGLYISYFWMVSVTKFSLFLVTMIECIILAWMYGAQRVWNNIADMTGSTDSPWWKITWRFLTPAIILVQK
jgi:SNF family Na+-dependent transporter